MSNQFKKLLSPLINIDLSFSENLSRKPFFKGKLPDAIQKPKHLSRTFLGYSINSPLGVAACPVTASSEAVKVVSRLGFDVITYKTVRSQAHPPHPFPNFVYVDKFNKLSVADLGNSINRCTTPHTDMEHLAIACSIGIAAPSLKKTLEEIAIARQSLKFGQILIVSIFGMDTAERSMVDDFAYLAAQVKDAGAHAVEANFSCPNVKNHGTIYTQPKLVHTIAKGMSAVLKGTPLIIKMGVFSSKSHMKESLCAAARAGVQGICGINSLSMSVMDEDNKSVFPGRKHAGVSGAPIRELALSFVRDMVEINQQEKLELAILATGGVTRAEHFDPLLKAGADIAMSATGIMFDQNLALNYIDMQNQIIHQQTVAEKQY